MKSSEAEVILIGNELLKGERRDAHLSFIGDSLMSIGVRLSAGYAIGDDQSHIADLVRSRVSATRVLLISGGLGPTHDDITREAVADGLNLPLEYNEDEWHVVEKIFESFGKKPDESNRRQAYFPKGAIPIPNKRGTAAGFLVEQSESLVVVLPGPPRELIPMMQTVVLDKVQDVFGRPPIFRQVFRTTGIGESSMTPLVQPLFDKYTDFEVSSLPHVGGVDIVITQKDGDANQKRVQQSALDFESNLRDALGDKIFGTGRDTLEGVIGAELSQRGATIAIAESLTGGLIGKRMTDTPGSSKYVLADVVAYSNESKASFLGVAEESIVEHGAVSEAVCREMANGVRQKTGATFALATTGIAGPEGGTKDKPVGLTYFGLSWEGGDDIRHRVFPGAREDVRSRVAYASLWLLYARLFDK